jgi:hypothetical protein
MHAFAIFCVAAVCVAVLQVNGFVSLHSSTVQALVDCNI